MSDSGVEPVVAWAEEDLGPVVAQRLRSREVFQADPSIQGPSSKNYNFE
jgi:hypothetical protein